jgi:hypothetical protein
MTPKKGSATWSLFVSYDTANTEEGYAIGRSLHR